MTEYDNNLKGVLFKNDHKRPDKKDPDYRGSCEIEGKAYWLDSWVNTTKAGDRKFLSLRFRLKEPESGPAASTQPVAPEAEFNDDIPF